MSQRQTSDFLAAWSSYTENTESPSSYHLWGGISVIASCLRRRVYMDWGHTRIFPNQYVVLVGPSGNRKGEPITIASEMLEGLESIHLIPEATTRQSLARFLKNSVETFQDETGTPVSECAVTGLFEELSVFLGEGDSKFLGWLTNWYDSRGSWTYDTKNAGTDEVLGVCMNMFASTAPDWIPLFLPFMAIGGGFTSRIIFIVEHKKGQIIEDPNEVEIDLKLKADLIHDMQVITQLAGEMRFDREALALYKEWYRRQEESVAGGNPPIQDPRFSGYVSRRATHIKKLAMISSVSRDSSKLIIAADFHRARTLLEGAEQAMPFVFSAVGRSQYAVQTDSVREFIQERGSISKQELLRLLYYDIDVKTLEVVEEQLTAMGVVRREVQTDTGDVIYHWLG